MKGYKISVGLGHLNFFIMALISLNCYLQKIYILSNVVTWDRFEMIFSIEQCTFSVIYTIVICRKFSLIKQFKVNYYKTNKMVSFVKPHFFLLSLMVDSNNSNFKNFCKNMFIIHFQENPKILIFFSL